MFTSRMATENISIDSLTFLDLDGKETHLTDKPWKHVLLVFLRHLA